MDLPRRRDVVVTRRPSTEPASGETPQQRATRLLFEYLTDEQRRTWTKQRFVRVIGSEGGRYCLHVGPHEIGVFLSNEGDVHEIEFCVHVCQMQNTSGRAMGDHGVYQVAHPLYFGGFRHGDSGPEIPVADHALVYVMLISMNEPAFRLKAIATPSRHSHHELIRPEVPATERDVRWEGHVIRFTVPQALGRPEPPRVMPRLR